MSRPNVLLITTDQQRFDTINALGNQHIYTPHLNWLSDEGTVFSRCYADCPVCMPSRNTIMTGKHGYTLGLVENSHAIRPMVREATLPGILTANGYQTRAQGKMHFSPMRATYGFEHVELPMDYFRERTRLGPSGRTKMHGVGENEMEPVICTANETDSLTHWVTLRSIDFLETRDDSRPFFLWTSFTKPHPPFDPPASFWDLYRDMNMPVPITGDWSESLEMIPQGYLRPTYSLNNAYRLSTEQLKAVKRAYYACITHIDYSLGLLFARMREMGLLENTWIIFTSDHGDMMGDHHMGAKSVFFEGSAHIPLIIRPPSVRDTLSPLAARQCDAPASLSDILPTVLAIADVRLPEGMDGRNLLDSATDSARNRVLFGNHANTFFMVMEDGYKYLWTSLGGAELLFDLHTDPEERKNLVTDAANAGRLQHLRGRLFEHARRYGAPTREGSGFRCAPAPRGPADVPKWPGFHSTQIPTDLLH